jgi:hypothetical protein
MANGKPGAPKGHPRYGGRVAGVRNKATREREAHLVEVLLAERLTPEQLAELTAVQVLQRIMRAELMAGDLVGAKASAIALAPYQSARLSSVDMTVVPTSVVRDPSVILAEMRQLIEAEAEAEAQAGALIEGEAATLN